MAKSKVFSVKRNIPVDISVGEKLQFLDGSFGTISKIISVRFLDMQTYEVTGFYKEVL